MLTNRSWNPFSGYCQLNQKCLQQWNNIKIIKHINLIWQYKNWIHSMNLRQFIIVINFKNKLSFVLNGWKKAVFSFCCSCTFFISKMNEICFNEKWKLFIILMGQTVIQERFVLMIKLQSILFSIIHNWKWYCLLWSLLMFKYQKFFLFFYYTYLDSLALVPRIDLLSSYHRCWTLNLIKFCAQKMIFILFFVSKIFIFKDH